MLNLRNPREYIEQLLYIRTKEGDEVRLRLKPAQEKLYAVVREQALAAKPVRVIVLKARQMGFSTLISALIFHACATQENRNALIVAHQTDATSNLHQMHRRFYDRLPELLRPMRSASNAIELRFENPTRDVGGKAARPGLRSRLRCTTAGGRGIGRSDTLQFLHASEYAFWPDGIVSKSDTLLGLLQAVPAAPGTMVFLESTANGFDDFKKRWDDAVAGRSDYVPVFFAWFEDPDYRRPVELGTEWTDEEHELRARFGLDEEQLAWRRWCIANNCGGDLEKFHQEYPATPEEAFIASGACWFDTGVVTDRLAEMAADSRRYRVGKFVYKVVYDEALQHTTLEDVRFVEAKDGPISIYCEPEERTPYVLGGDTAGEGSDWFGAFVIDNTSCRTVAKLHQICDEAEYARQVFCLGRYFNEALIGLEVNYSTYPTAILEDMGYPRLYVRQRVDSMTHKVRDSFGHLTDRITRPAMLAELKTVFEAHPELFPDEELLREMLAFVKDERGRPAAIAGEHDDLVMSMAITLFIRGQQTATRKAAPHEKAKWTRDMYEDYWAESPAGRKALLAEWGNPF